MNSSVRDLWTEEFRRNIAWFFNINQEQYWNESKEFPSVTDTQQLVLVKQQEQQQLFLADSSDVVILHHKPDEQFLSYLEAKGMQLPRIIYRESDAPLDSLDLEGLLFVAYINSEDIFRETESIDDLEIAGSSYSVVKQVNNKFTARRVAEENGFRVTRGFFCHNTAELEHAYHQLRREGFEQCVIKIPYGSSGKGLKIIRNPEELRSFVRYAERRSPQFELLIEGWYPNGQNINCQLWVKEDYVDILCIMEQTIDDKGVYQGTHYTPTFDTALVDTYKAEMLKLGSLLGGLGYRGVCGIDSLIDADGHLYPIIEINGRLTQVTYIIPMVYRLMQQYRFVYSQFIRFDTKQQLTFEYILQRIIDALRPDDEHQFLIYTYAIHCLPDDSKTVYRIFVLFYGQQDSKVREMVANFTPNIFHDC